MVALVAAASLAAGCGAATPDLFLLTRTGSVAGARLTLLVNDAGTVRCNGGPPRLLPDRQLLQARELVRQLRRDARRHLRLAPRAGGVLSYRLRDADGTLAFGDTSAGLRPELARLEAFSRAVATGVCRLKR